ncbi:hypothetical protein RJ640_028117 [Escallonia rubra]|uniref:Triacylglycerol lipase 2 n=1 Tax=Escallonia rubra TaxID=112253 RepID=A0AA88SK55_9ASTE|nr:hypothetical protein RJ640_028117 [Escallonia rubra]
MASHSLLGLGVLSLWALVLTIQPYQALGSSRGSLGLITGSGAVDAAPPSGLCAAAVFVHGYECQEFNVITDDGFILSMQRIPEGRAGGGGIHKQPVLLQHGVLVGEEINRATLLKLKTVPSVQEECLDQMGNANPRHATGEADGGYKSITISSLNPKEWDLHHMGLSPSCIPMDGMTWLLTSPDQSLALILADAGYDVWIANTRGTRFSRRHLRLDPSNPAFWNWTWDDLVSHDLPAAIDFVFKQTGQKTHYVGHSMGTLIALASFSEGKQIDKVRSAALLSPIAYLSHMTTALGDVAARAFAGEITTLFGLAEFNPRGAPVASFLKALCAYPGVDCFDLLSALTGNNCCLNASTVELFLKNEPQSTATKNMVHLAQTVRDGKLAKYDYGSADLNVEHYGEAKPPVYNLANIPHNFPLFLSYGGRDALSDPRDVATLLDSLKLHDIDKLSVQYIKDYAHADFIMGVSAKDLVYNQILTFLRRN